MGRLHARVYSEMPSVKLTGVYDANREAAESAAVDYGCAVAATLDELLARSPVSKFVAGGVSVIGDHEDICNARLTFANGCVANVPASRLALKTERKLRVFSSDAYVSVDYQKRYGVVVRRTGNLETIRSAA